MKIISTHLSAFRSQWWKKIYYQVTGKSWIESFALMTALVILFCGFQVEGKSPQLSKIYQMGTINHSNSFLTNNKSNNLPAGLINLRNTCYFNSVLQSLFALTDFSDAILMDAYPFKSHSIGEELQILFEEMEERRGTLPTASSFGRPSNAILPKELALKMKIDIMEQEDAEELLLKIVNALDESLRKENPQDFMTTIKPSHALKFEMIQTIKCIEHNHISSIKTMDYLDLSIMLQACLTLEQAIEKYFEPEILKDDNKYKCSIHGYQNAEKNLTMKSFPKILTVHLKRFTFDSSTYRMKKLVDPIEIPVNLNLRKYCNLTNPNLPNHQPTEQPDQQTTSQQSLQSCLDPNLGLYNLSAVIVHEGSIEYGHYYAFVKVPYLSSYANITREEQTYLPSYQWVKVNDHVVTPVSEEIVLQIAKGGPAPTRLTSMYDKYFGESTVSTNAYLLFYTQQQ